MCIHDGDEPEYYPYVEENVESEVDPDVMDEDVVDPGSGDEDLSDFWRNDDENGEEEEEEEEENDDGMFSDTD